MISAEQALISILGSVPVLGTATVSLRRSEGSRLARDVVAASDVPPFDNAGMDGYAVRSSDIISAPVVLAVVGETAAGEPPGETLPPGAARAVMTGAPLPPGADAVVQIEWSERVSAREVRVVKPVGPGAHFRKQGSDIPRGSVALRAGHLVRPFELGVLASLGAGFVEVRRKPSVLVVPTGNELTPRDRTPGPGRIRESITPVLEGLLRAEGCEVLIAPITPDDPGRLAEAFAPRPGIDIVLTTGGVSAGRYDRVPAALEASGFETIFHRVNIKPGMPLLFGMGGAVPAFALPGNPVSAAVTFIQFVRPAIRKMSGDPEPAAKMIVRARLAVPITKDDGKRHYVRGRLETVDGEPTVRPSGAQTSNMASVLAAANCLIILPEEKREFPASSVVEAELL